MGSTRGLAESDARVPYMVELEDDEGNLDIVENPLLNQRQDVRRNGSTYLTTPLPQFRRQLPEFITGIDLKICEHIRQGHDYRKIGQLLSMTERAVSRRIARMRQEVAASKAPKA